MHAAAALIMIEAPILPPDDDEEDEPTAPFVHLVLSGEEAANAATPYTRAPRSIFDLAAAAAASKALRTGGRFGAAGGFVPSPGPAPAVQREGGVVKVTGARYPADRWTPEKAEAERKRRARQKPPRPTAKARTRGRKVRRWDGEDMDTDDHG